MTERNQVGDNDTPRTVRELGIKMAGFEQLVDAQFKTTNNSIQQLTEAVQLATMSKADKEDLERLVAQVTNYQTTNDKALEKLVTRKEMGVAGAVVTGAITIIGFVFNFIEHWKFVK